MSKQTLYCKLCHTPISHPLRLDVQVREFSPSQQDDSIHIPVDEAWIIEILTVNYHQSSDKTIWFSPQSLTDEVTTDRNLFGCCGYFGIGNTRCQLGHIVGSRVDECAYQPRFEPNPQMTYWAAGCCQPRK